MKTPFENPFVKIYLIRHGQTDWNLQRRLQGHTDIPLNETGKEQARTLKKVLTGIKIDAFFSSDLTRAKETAELAKENVEIPLHVIPSLREASLGEAEGVYIDELQEKFPDAYKRWLHVGEQDDSFAFPGGETKEQHRNRLLQSLHHIVESYPYSQIAIVSHGGAMRRLLEHSKHMPESGYITHNTSVFELHFIKEKKELHFIKKIYSPH